MYSANSKENTSNKISCHGDNVWFLKPDKVHQLLLC